MDSDKLNGFFKNLGIVIYRRRQELGLSQAELAQITGIHRTYVSDLENGKRNFSLGTLNALAKSLEITVTELIERAGG